jgi:predicted permease
MSWIRRFGNVFRQGQVDREIEEELSAHLEEAVEQGRSEAEARRALGPALRYREQSRDIRLLPWLDSLISDVTFGWRQLNKHRAVSAAAILSLALATGATTGAFRLVDAVLLRTLPVAEPNRLSYLAINEIDPRDHRPALRDDFDYPTYRKYATFLGDHADLLVVGMSATKNALFGGDEPEEIYRQFVSGNMFGVFGLRPAAGRLLMPADDDGPGAHAVAVLSHHFWARRFGRDPRVIGKRFRLGGASYQIVGVAPQGFTGTEPGIVTDVFVPATMNVTALNSPGWSWFRLWVRPKPGVSGEQIVQPLQAALNAEMAESMPAVSDLPKELIEMRRSRSVALFPAAFGASDLQKEYRRPLEILTLLVALILLIACANVGNLLAAQAAARAREMALRVSIGAGRWRLIQLVLAESALLAAIASAAGAFFSWWAAPLVVTMLAPAETPVRLVLDVDWHALCFGAALTVSITILFGLAPALRARSVKPMAALKGGIDPRGHRGLMQWLLATQVAFCVVVLLIAGLFVATFERLSHRPLGFSPHRLLALETGGSELSAENWQRVAGQVREMRGVESVALAGWMPLSGNHWTGTVRVGGDPEPISPYLLDVSPGYFATMGIGWLDGRDFRAGDVQPRLVGDNRLINGVGIVNEAFARQYFDGQNPVGKTVGLREGKNLFAAMEIVGYVKDSVYSDVREKIRPTIYLPLESRSGVSLIVRTTGDPRTIAPGLRRAVPRLRPGLMVRSMLSQSSLVLGQMVRERLLAMLSLFFSIVAVVLAAVGLYGVLNYWVVQRRREIGIRVALGAGAAQVVRRVAGSSLRLVTIGVVLGLAGGLACQRLIESLLYEVKATDPWMLGMPLAILLCAAAMAAVPPAMRAVRIDPAETLRAE